MGQVDPKAASAAPIRDGRFKDAHRPGEPAAYPLRSGGAALLDQATGVVANPEAVANARRSDERVIGSDVAMAVGRFAPDGPHGYRSKAGGPLRSTRKEAEADYLAYLNEREDSHAAS